MDERKQKLATQEASAGDVAFILRDSVEVLITGEEDSSGDESVQGGTV